MSRNVYFTDQKLYVVTKKLHRLFEIDIIKAIEQVKSGGAQTGDSEQGELLGTEVTDFAVDSDDQSIWILYENGSIEHHGGNASRNSSYQGAKVADQSTGKLEMTAIAKGDGVVVAAGYNGSGKNIVYSLFDEKLKLKHHYTQIVEEPGACAHKMFIYKKKGYNFLFSLRFKNRVDLFIIANGHLHTVEVSKWVGGGDEGSHHGMIWTREGDEVLIWTEKSIRAIRLL